MRFPSTANRPNRAIVTQFLLPRDIYLCQRQRILLKELKIFSRLVGGKFWLVNLRHFLVSRRCSIQPPCHIVWTIWIREIILLCISSPLRNYRNLVIWFEVSVRNSFYLGIHEVSDYLRILKIYRKVFFLWPKSENYCCFL